MGVRDWFKSGEVIVTEEWHGPTEESMLGKKVGPGCPAYQVYNPPESELEQAYQAKFAMQRGGYEPPPLAEGEIFPQYEAPPGDGATTFDIQTADYTPPPASSGNPDFDIQTASYTPPPVSEKNIAKKFARDDRLRYGFTFMFDRYGLQEFITLFINPEIFEQNEPARIAITQTRGGAFVDNFGWGLKTVTLRGITGFRSRDMGGRTVSGHEHFLELRTMIRDWTFNSKVDPDQNHLYFYNWADEEYYEIAVTNFQLLRNVNRPLLYQYNLTFTVLQNLSEKPEWRPEDEAYTDYMNAPEKRAPIVGSSLTGLVENVNDIVDGNIDISGMTEGTQTWAGLIGKGVEYYNTATEAYETVESVISDVEDLAGDISMFVSGATSFISKPFELVRDLATSIGDVIDSMCSVKNVPHELVRDFREMICAIKVLPEKLFKGFTNPDLFAGASNCGTTLGIPEAPVAPFDNSFEATAQVPPKRNVSQVFKTPKPSLVLQETPLQIQGVFLETDVGRTGSNYFDKVEGNTVSLTSVPETAVVVDYVKTVATTSNVKKLEAASGKVVDEWVILGRLAQEAYGDPSKWKDIALYNELEYPYIVPRNFVKERRATGLVRFYRTFGFLGPIVVPKGMLLYVPAYQGTIQINFITTEEKTIPLSEDYIDVPVECERLGEIGNVSAGRITGFVPLDLPEPTSIDRISNVVSTQGGKTWNVMKPGDIILIPKDVTNVVSVVIGAKKSYEELFGVDIKLNRYGELEGSNETNKDLGRVSGVGNLVQALKNRIATEKRFYVYHAEYGTNLPFYIGKKNNPHWADLVKVDIRSACLLDPRIDSISRFLMRIDGDVIGIDMDAVPINEHTSLPINLIV